MMGLHISDVGLLGSITRHFIRQFVNYTSHKERYLHHFD
jgi:hypothetical protein